MKVSNYETSDKRIIVYQLNSNEEIGSHTHEWDHSLVCVMGAVNYFDETGFSKLLSDKDDKHEVIAKKGISHGFRANNTFSIVLNIINKTELIK